MEFQLRKKPRTEEGIHRSLCQAKHAETKFKALVKRFYLLDARFFYTEIPDVKHHVMRGQPRTNRIRSISAARYVGRVEMIFLNNRYFLNFQGFAVRWEYLPVSEWMTIIYKIASQRTFHFPARRSSLDY